MPNTTNGRTTTQQNENEQFDTAITAQSTHDWSHTTKELVDNLPQVWTRGLLYFLVVFISIVLPWAILAKVDETGTARGRLEPKGKTIRLDAAVEGTVKEIRIKEGDSVKAGQSLSVLESELVKAELRQVQDKLEGQLHRLSQLNILKNQLVSTSSTQQEQNQAQALEKQAQIDQAKQNLETLKHTYNLQKAEKFSQVNQAKETLKTNQTASKILVIRLKNAQHEVERYKEALQEGIASEIQVVEKEDVVKERQQLSEQTKSEIEQGKLRLAEQKSSYERTIQQAQAEIGQAKLRLNEQQESYQGLTHSSKLAVFKIEEQLKNLETEMTTLKSDIAQSQSQVESLKFQLEQRALKAPVSGTIFQLPIQRPGAVVQPGTMIAEIAPLGSSLVMRAQMATTESGFLHKGLPVKVKFDAYPFQDYGIVEGKLLGISPTTSEMETPNGKVETYKLEIALNQNCIATTNQCIVLRPGDTATAEVIIRQRRIIDLLLDPFKKLQQGGIKL